MDHLAHDGASLEVMTERLTPLLRGYGKREPSLTERHPILKPFVRGAVRVKSRIIQEPRLQIQSDHMLMNGLRAGVGINGLAHLDQVNRARNRHAAVLKTALEESTGFITPTVNEKKQPAYLKFNILNRTGYPLQQIFKAAHAAGLELSNAQWSLAIHQQPAFLRRIQFQQDDLLTSAHLSSHIINLPIHYYVQDEEINRILTFLEGFEREPAITPQPLKIADSV